MQRRIKINLNLAKEKTSLPEIGENEAIKIEPVEAEIENKLEEERILKFIKYRLKPKFPWLQLSDGKLFCTVRNTVETYKLLQGGAYLDDSSFLAKMDDT